MGDLDSSSLLCQEDESCFFNGYEDINRDDPCFVLEDEDVEYTEKLIERESSSSSSSDFGCTSDHFYANSSIVNCSDSSHGWLNRARFSVVGWILNTRAAFGFRFLTAYLAVTYFDKFLSKRSIDDGQFWAIRLLSVACLSLAAKMEECKVPVLSDFLVEDYPFDNKVIQRMELLVLTTLEWRMGSTTPFGYLHYFANKFCGEFSPKGTLVSKSVELIVAFMTEINLLDRRPSVVAAAAVLAAAYSELTRKDLEVKMKSTVPTWSSAENQEHILSCYNLMLGMEMGKVMTPEQVISPVSSSTVEKNSVETITSAVGTKRRLTFNDYDCPEKKICRPSQ